MPKRKRTPGLPPGSLVKEAGEFLSETQLYYFNYNVDFFEEKKITSLSELPAISENSTLWLNIEGIHHAEALKEIGDHFKLHPLLLEDILNTDQRPKFDEFEDVVALILRMYYSNSSENLLEGEQVAIVLGKGFVLSFQEKPGDIFDPVRERLRKSSGRIRTRKSDFLLYALTDIIIDHYFLLIENLGDKVEFLEEEIFSKPSEDNLEQIHVLKRELLTFRRNTFPLREAISQIQRSPTELIEVDTHRFLTDAYDHIINIIDLLENYRELNSGLKDIYMSGVSLRMNKIMQVLTIVSTIFIPLTFIAGIYGMNFENMPELGWHYGYMGVWVIMLLTVVVMLFFFRKKRWL